MYKTIDICYRKRSVKNMKNDKLKFYSQKDYEREIKYLPHNNDEGSTYRSNLILQSNTFCLPPYKEKTYKKNIDWDNGESRSYLRLLNGHVFIGDLIESHNTTKDKKYILKGLEIINKWIKDNPFEDKKHTMAYHDETTALRMKYWMKFFIYTINLLEYDDIKEFYDNIVFTAELLASDLFYAGKNNHGMFQDISLLLYTICLCKEENINKYAQIAIKRLEDYFEYIYTEDGISKEHSPEYHIMITRNLKEYLEILNLTDYVADHIKFNDILNNAQNFITHITKPNGHLPVISDTNETNLKKINKNLFDSQHFKYAMSSGQYGEKPEVNDIVYKKSGYAVFRNSWDKKDKATHIVFTAAYHGSYHKHCDDLNILIYSKHGDIITEAGPNGYDYEDPYTEYGFSSFAHNTLIVNKKSLPRVDGKYDKVKILDYRISDLYSEVKGINSRYEDVTHKRQVRYYKKEDKIIVKDTINSELKNTYTINWHLDADIELFVEGNIVNLYKDKSLIGEITFASSAVFNINHIFGQVEPYIQGWVFSKMRVKKETNTIEIEYEDIDNVELETIIRIF